MSSNTTITQNWPSFELLPADVRGLQVSERDSLIVSAIKVEGQWVILSRYGDNIWQLDGFTNSTPDSRRRVDFTHLPVQFQAVMKAVLYRFLQRGRGGMGRPRGSTLHKFLICSRPFLKYLETLNVGHLGAVTPITCMSYVEVCRAHRQTRRSKGKPLSAGGLWDRFSIVEALYELSQYTDDPIPQHPWPDTSALAMAGLTGSVSYRSQESKTRLMPDDVFCTLFERAYEQVQQGKTLLDLRDALAAIAVRRNGQHPQTISMAKSRYLADLNLEGGMSAFNKSILDLRTACYVVLASTSGCRNHELANLQSGAHRRTGDDQGTRYHWIRSISEKTDTGVHDWMIPEAAVRALRLMERWAEPYQTAIAAEITVRRKLNPHDPEISKAQQHRYSLFLGESQAKGNQVRTLSNASWDANLKLFAKDLGLDWALATHQFRRKFANYVAHSRFGDLRYLREHFAHWTIDMSLGYAIDRDWGQHFDIDLYNDIHSELEGIKQGVVGNWLGDTPLSGGYGYAIKRWQRDPSNLAIFKSHSAMVNSIAESTSIRSNGHAWCTADDNRCIGNTLERTRCSGCNNAVIGPSHAPIYRHLYESLKGLLNCPDISDGGRQRVLRNLGRCRDVLEQLGYDPESNAS